MSLLLVYWESWGFEVCEVAADYKGGKGDAESSRERSVCFARRTWHLNAKMSGEEGELGFMMVLEELKGEGWRERRRTRR